MLNWPGNTQNISLKNILYFQKIFLHFIFKSRPDVGVGANEWDRGPTISNNQAREMWPQDHVTENIQYNQLKTEE